MANQDVRTGGTTGISGLQQNQEFQLTKRVNFATYPLTQNDLVSIFNIPAGCVVEGVAAKTITAEGATCLLDVGDADTANLYLDDHDANTADSVKVSISTTTAVWKVYTAAGIIKAKAMSTGGADAAVVDFVVWGRKLFD